jgi:hypothetical protein
MSDQGDKSVELVPSITGKYIDLFEAIFQSIRNGSEFPVKELEVLAQIEILESRLD